MCTQNRITEPQHHSNNLDGLILRGSPQQAKRISSDLILAVQITNTFVCPMTTESIVAR